MNCARCKAARRWKEAGVSGEAAGNRQSYRLGARWHRVPPILEMWDRPRPAGVRCCGAGRLTAPGFFAIPPTGGRRESLACSAGNNAVFLEALVRFLCPVGRPSAGLPTRDGREACRGGNHKKKKKKVVAEGHLGTRARPPRWCGGIREAPGPGLHPIFPRLEPFRIGNNRGGGGRRLPPTGAASVFRRVKRGVSASIIHQNPCARASDFNSLPTDRSRGPP